MNVCVSYLCTIFFSSDVPGGQSSPGTLQSGQHASKAFLHIPQQSSFTFHLHAATPCHSVSLVHLCISLFHRRVLRAEGYEFEKDETKKKKRE